MADPQSVSPQSIMPAYPWLISNKLDNKTLTRKIEVMQYFGVPYPEGYGDNQALIDLEVQANKIANNLKNGGIETTSDKEIIALIAYLQRLGTDIYKK